MAGRLLTQKLSSGVYGSTGRLSRAVAPATRTASEATKVLIAQEGSVSTLSKVFHGAAVHPVKPAMYSSIVPCSHAKVKTIWPVKRAFSSSSFNKCKVSSGRKMTPRRISIAEHTAALKKDENTALVLAVLTGLGWIYIESKT